MQRAAFGRRPEAMVVDEADGASGLDHKLRPSPYFGFPAVRRDIRIGNPPSRSEP